MATRIVGGACRNRALATLEGNEVRPTSSLLRKVAFDMIGHRIRNARALDLYAGIGSLGMEALSRGAAHCTFVERGRPAFALLTRNLRTLGLSAHAHALCGSVEQFLENCNEFFDVILVDPPYNAAARVTVADCMRRLSAGGFLMYQCAAGEHEENPAQSRQCRIKRHGISEIRLYERKTETA